ncbi:LysM peptidoglycan-binding domain-containing protein [Brevibacterium luteolum]|uniref:LysM peptidoglycan-binding domain-containing protein n=1 Tax=Brevibacterium luteolum TaxID=199591 RepID=UPI00223C0EC3|nr:LysM peptidoglycan-binding domain-containing protein [Brevibacterium luteolum]MCT1922467.1 LysM peptidoglycan-binding domain-containing protein [Brevibacterium luteolum]
MSSAAMNAWSRAGAEHRTWRLTPRGKQGLRLLRTIAMAAVIAGAAALLVLMVRPQQAIGSAEPVVPADTVVVEQGQSLWTIATEATGSGDPRDTMQAIIEMNGLETSVVHPGQELEIPAR